VGTRCCSTTGSMSLIISSAPTSIAATSSLSRYRRESLIELAHIRKSLFVGAKSVKEHIG
jgi:hypothetical protein